MKRKKKMRGQVENPKGQFSYKKDTQIENLKGRSRKKEIDQGHSGSWNPVITKLRQSVERQSLTYAQKRLKTLAEELVRDRIYGLLTQDISSVHCAVYPFCTPILLGINKWKESFYFSNNPLLYLQILTLLNASCVYFIA